MVEEVNSLGSERHGSRCHAWVSMQSLETRILYFEERNQKNVCPLHTPHWARTVDYYLFFLVHARKKKKNKDSLHHQFIQPPSPCKEYHLTYVGRVSRGIRFSFYSVSLHIPLVGTMFVCVKKWLGTPVVCVTDWSTIYLCHLVVCWCVYPG